MSATASTEGSPSRVMNGLCYELATALVGGGVLPEQLPARLQQFLPGLEALSVALACPDGEHLLYYPLLGGAGHSSSHPAATARCRSGTAVWEAFEAGQELHYEGELRRGHWSARFADWQKLHQDHSVTSFRTLPLEAAQGMLGAITVASSGQNIVGGLVQPVAALLGQCLAHVKACLDLQVAVTVLEAAYPPGIVPHLLANAAAAQAAAQQHHRLLPPLPSASAGRTGPSHHVVVGQQADLLQGYGEEDLHEQPQSSNSSSCSYTESVPSGGTSLSSFDPSSLVHPPPGRASEDQQHSLQARLVEPQPALGLPYSLRTEEPMQLRSRSRSRVEHSRAQSSTSRAAARSSGWHPTGPSATPEALGLLRADVYAARRAAQPAQAQAGRWWHLGFKHAPLEMRYLAWRRTHTRGADAARLAVLSVAGLAAVVQLGLSDGLLSLLLVLGMLVDVAAGVAAAAASRLHAAHREALQGLGSLLLLAAALAAHALRRPVPGWLAIALSSGAAALRLNALVHRTGVLEQVVTQGAMTCVAAAAAAAAPVCPTPLTAGSGGGWPLHLVGSVLLPLAVTLGCELTLRQRFLAAQQQHKAE